MGIEEANERSDDDDDDWGIVHRYRVCDVILEKCMVSTFKDFWLAEG